MDANKQKSKNSEKLSKKSFENFFQKNNKLFSLIGLSNSKKILKAVWDARNEEVRELEIKFDRRVLDLEKQLMNHRIDFEKRLEIEKQNGAKLLENNVLEQKSAIEQSRKLQEHTVSEFKKESQEKVDYYHKSFEELEKKYLENIAEFKVEKEIWSTGMLERDHDIKNLREHIEKLKTTLIKMKETYITSEEEGKESKVMLDEMLAQNVSLVKKIESLEKGHNMLEKALGLELKNRKKIEEYAEKLELNIQNNESTQGVLTKKYQTQIAWLRSEITRYEKSIEDAKSYSKKYKELNARLSYELMHSKELPKEDGHQYF